MSSSLSSSPCHCSHPHSPACGIVHPPPGQQNFPGLSPPKGPRPPPSSSWGHWVGASLLGPVHKENPGSFGQSPTALPGNQARVPQHRSLCALPHPQPAWWHLVKVVAAPGLWVPAPETLIISSQSPLVRPVQCPSITVGLFSPGPAL